MQSLFINKDYFFKEVEKRKVQPGKINNSEQALVLEVWHYFGKKISFGQLMTFIKKYGQAKVYESFNTVKQSLTCKNPPGMFLYLCKK